MATFTPSFLPKFDSPYYGKNFKWAEILELDEKLLYKVETD